MATKEKPATTQAEYDKAWEEVKSGKQKAPSFDDMGPLPPAKKDQTKKVYQFLLYALGLGLLFVLFQFLGWNQLVSNNIHFSGGNPSESFFYALSGLHLAHLFFGVVSLAVTSFKAKKNRYSSTNYLGISLCAIYWHFLDFLWLILFVFLALFR